MLNILSHQEMKNKIPLRIYLSPVRMAIIKKTKKCKCWQGCWQGRSRENPLDTVAENEIYVEFPQNLKNRTTM
jgi:hypothetical protein